MTLILSGTNGLSDVDGDASTPAIRGSDSNTGIFFGTDIIGFSEGGTEAMRIDSTGQVKLATGALQVFGALDTGQISAGVMDWQSATNNTRFLSYGPSGTAGGFTWTSVVGGGSGTVPMTLDSSGNLLVGITTARANAGDVQVSKGISFPATQSAQSDANTLDDYEEGTWTPTYLVASGTITTNSNTSGRYTKIGRTVFIWGYVSYQSNSGASGAVTVGGLPFTGGTGFGQATNRSGGVYTIGNSLWTSNSPNFGNIGSGSTQIDPFISTATSFTGLTFADFSQSTNHSQFVFAGQYNV